MNAAVFIGQPLHFRKGIDVYPPLIKDMLSLTYYSSAVQIFTTSQEDIWDMIAEKNGKAPDGTPITDAPTPFELMLNNQYHHPEIMKITEKAFELFTHEKVRIIPESKIILFTNGIEEVKEARFLRTIEESDFFDFQNLVRQVVGKDPVEPPNPHEKPKIAIIKAKGRLRERIKQKKGNQNSISLDTLLGALCCMNLGLNPLNIGEIPYPSAARLFELAQDKEKYETDLRIATAGFGNSKVKPKYWIKNSDN